MILSSFTWEAGRNFIFFLYQKKKKNLEPFWEQDIWVMYEDFASVLYTALLSVFKKNLFNRLNWEKDLREKILPCSKKNRERERSKFLICIKICIYSGRVESSICVFRHWWERAPGRAVSSSLPPLSESMHVAREPACVCSLQCATHCPCAGTDFMLASVCISQCQVFTFRAAPKFSSLNS